MNILRLQKSADRMIRGAGGLASLIRGSVRRDCFAARMEFKPTERGLFEDGAERFFISSLNLAIPPDAEQDILEFQGKAAVAKRYRIIKPPAGPRPNGIVVYFDCACMFVTEV
jgi:hypothetical protein